MSCPEHQTRTATVTVHDGIVSLRINGQPHQRRDAEENVAAVQALVQGHAAPLLLDIRQAGPMETDARDIYRSSAVDDITTACAILIDSVLSHLIARVMILAHGHHHIRAFREETAARLWLEQFRSSEGTAEALSQP